MKRLAIGTAVVALALVSVPSEASSITISYISAGGCSGSSSGPTYSDTCTSGVTTSVAADASLDLLKLSLHSAGTFPVGLPSDSAQIRITDTLTVTGGIGSGTLVWNWAFDGTLDASDGFYAQMYMNNLGGGAFADFRACGNNVQFGSFICYYDAAPNPPGGLVAAQPHETVAATRSISIPFVFGVALDVDWRLNAVIANGCTFGNNCNNPVTGSGTVDINTLQLQPLVVLDSSGAQVGSASALSTSGFSYAVAPTVSPVPEPTSLLLLGTGLAALAVRRRFTKLK